MRVDSRHAKLLARSLAFAFVALESVPALASQISPAPRRHLFQEAELLVHVEIESVCVADARAYARVLKVFSGTARANDTLEIAWWPAYCPAPPTFTAQERQILVLRADPHSGHWQVRYNRMGQIHAATQRDIDRLSADLRFWAEFSATTDAQGRRKLQAESLITWCEDPNARMDGLEELLQCTDPDYAMRYADHEKRAAAGDAEAAAYLRMGHVPLVVSRDFTPEQLNRLRKAFAAAPDSFDPWVRRVRERFDGKVEPAEKPEKSR